MDYYTNVNIMFKYVYVVLLSFLPFVSIFGNEVDYSNFYALIVYINLLLAIGVVGIWFKKETVSISRIEVCVSFLCVMSLISSMVNGVAVCHFNYYGILSSIMLVIFSKNFVREKIALLNIMLIYNIIIINLLILVVSTFDANLMVTHLGNSGISAIFISVSACIVLKIASDVRNHKLLVRLLCCLLIIADLYYIYIYESRTAFIVIAIFLLIGGMRRNRCVRFVLFVVLALVFMLAMDGNVTKYQSFVGRSFILKNCVSLFMRNPLIGNGGIGSFSVKYPMQQAQYFSTYTEMDGYFMTADNVMVACNEYVQLLCETGIIGVGICVVIAFYLIKQTKNCYFRKVILFSILVSALFYYILHTALFCALLLICMVVASALSPPLFQIKLSNSNTSLLGVVVIAAMIYSVHHFMESKTIRKYIENRSVSECQGKYIVRNFKENKVYIASIAMLNNTEEIDNNINKLIVHSDILFHQGQKLRRQKKYRHAMERLQLASCICPNRFRYKYEMFKIYKETNDMHNAYKMAVHINKMPVKIHSPTVLAIKNDTKTFLQNHNVK